MDIPDPREKKRKCTSTAPIVSLLQNPVDDIDMTQVLCPVTGQDITMPLDQNAIAAEPSIDDLHVAFAAVLNWTNTHRGTLSNYPFRVPEEVKVVSSSATTSIFSPPSSSSSKASSSQDQATTCKLPHVSVVTPSSSSSSSFDFSTFLTSFEDKPAFVPDHLVQQHTTKAPLPSWPILLIVNHEAQDPSSGGGFDIICHPCTAPCLWKAFVFAGAHAVRVTFINE
jgi:hypothetical protein